MKNKLIIAIIMFVSLVLLSSICYASNEIVGGVTGDAINGTANVTRDVVEGTSNVARNIADGVGSATESAVNGIANVTGDVANGTRNMVNDVMNDMDNDSLRSSTTNEYNATRTGAMSGNTFMGMDTTTWWWLIIAIIVILGVFLIWRYSNNSDDSEE